MQKKQTNDNEIGLGDGKGERYTLAIIFKGTEESGWIHTYI